MEMWGSLISDVCKEIWIFGPHFSGIRTLWIPIIMTSFDMIKRRSRALHPARGSSRNLNVAYTALDTFCIGRYL